MSQEELPAGAGMEEVEDEGPLHPLLFTSTNIFPEATIIDCIHHSHIDLKTKKIAVDEVARVLRAMLDTAHEWNCTGIRDDMVAFVSDCFAKHPGEFMDVYKEFLDQAYSRIICFQMTIFIEITLVRFGQPVEPDFVKNALAGFRNFNGKDDIEVGGLEFNPQEAMFSIHHLLRVFPVTEEELKPFVGMLFPEEAVEYRLDLVAKIAESGLLSMIPEKYYTTLAAFENSLRPARSFADLVPLMPENSFLGMAVQLETFAITEKSHKVSNAYLRRCIDTKFTNFTKLDVIVNSLKACAFDSAMINFLKPFELILSDDIAAEITEFTDTEFYMMVLNEPQKYLDDEQIKAFFDTCEDPAVIRRVLKPLFTHPCLTQPEMWNKLIKLLTKDDYKKCGQCFVANSIDVAESAMKLLLLERPMNDGAAEFLRAALNTKALKDQFVASPLMTTLLGSICKQPCFSFWRLFSKSRCLIEYVVGVNFRCPYVMYGLTVVTSFTKLDPNFQTIYIEEQTEESLAEIGEYVQKLFTDKTSMFTSIDGKAPGLSLMAAAHYYGTRLAYNQQNAEYVGLTPQNILHFAVVACITYSVTTRLHAAPVMLSLFSNDQYYSYIVQALYEHSPISGRFSQAILVALPTLYLFHTFTGRLMPIIQERFRSGMYDDRHMALFFIYLSSSTASPTSFIRRSMIKDEGYVRNASDEPNKQNIEKVREQERKFWRSIGEDAIQFLAKQRFEDDDYPQKFHFELIEDKTILTRIVNNKPTMEAIRFIQEFTQSPPEIEIEHPDEIFVLLDQAIEKNDSVHARAIAQFLAKSKFSERLIPYFKKKLHPTVTLAMTSIFKTTDIASIRENITVDFVIDLMAMKQRILDPKIRYFVERILSDDDTLLHAYMLSLEGIQRSFCLTTQTVSTLHWDEIRRRPEIFAKAVHAIYASPSLLPSVLIRRPKRLTVPPPSEFSVSVAEHMMREGLTRRSVALLSWLPMFLRSHPFLFTGIDPYFVFENIMSLLCDFMESKTGRRFQLWVVVMTILHSYISMPAIADKFFEWFFAYRNMFNDHQLYAVLLIIRSLLEPNSVKYVMVGTLFRYHWFTFRVTERTAEQFAIATEMYMKLLVNVGDPWFPDLGEIVMCDAPFTRAFDGVLSIGRLLVNHDPMKYIIPQLGEEEAGFVNKITRDRLFKRESESADADLLQGELAKLENPEPDYSWVPDHLSVDALKQLPEKWVSTVLHHNMPRFPNKLTLQMNRYLAWVPRWVASYIKCPSTLLLLPEHYKEIYETVDKLYRIQAGEQLIHRQETTSRTIPVPNITFKPLPTSHSVEVSVTSTSLSFRPDLDERARAKQNETIDDMDESERKAANSDWPKHVDGFCLSENEHVDPETGLVYVDLHEFDWNDMSTVLFRGSSSFFDCLLHFCKGKWETEKYSGDLLAAAPEVCPYYAIDMYQDQFPNLVLTKENLTAAVRLLLGMGACKLFAEGVNNALMSKLLLMIYKPQFRRSQKLLKYTSQFTAIITHGIPNRACHLINLMLLSKDNLCLTEALIPFSKLGEDQQYENLPSLERALDGIIQKSLDREVPTEALLNYARIVPDLISERRSEMIKIVSKLLARYVPENALLIAHLFGILQPYVTVDTPVCHQELPKEVFDSDPEFWKMVIKHRAVISRMASENLTLLDNHVQFLLVYPFLLDFPIKFKLFQRRLKTLVNNRRRKIHVLRDSILQDSFASLEGIDPSVWYGEFSVQFIGEPGIDMGGVRKDWITSLVRTLFNPEYAFFTENRVPNPASGINANHLKYFEFAGRILAKAVFDGVNVDCHLPTFLYKEICGSEIGLADFRDDPSYNSLQWILENDPVDLDLRFVADREDLGKHIEVPLKPDGENIVVTNENKEEFVRLLVRHRLIGQAEEQIKSFIRGFHSIIEPDDLRIFAPSDLDLIICGVPTVDVRDMKKHCQYIYPLHADHPTVQRFWVVIRHWAKEDLAKLLMFITGSSQVPVGGFAAYAACRKPFTLAAGGDWDRLPVAHTCSNTLDLPAYRSEQEMNQKLHFAISECNAFGFA